MGKLVNTDRFVLIPEKDNENEQYPGDIQPGWYSLNDILSLLRKHNNSPSIINFISDMLEL